MRSASGSYALAGAVAAFVAASAGLHAIDHTGYLRIQHYWLPGTPNNSVTNLTMSPNYPDNPDYTFYSYYDTTYAPKAYAWNDYGAVMSGYLSPYSGGDFQFAIAADDNAELWISTDATEANLKLVAREPQYAVERYDFGGNAAGRRTDADKVDPAQSQANITVPITMVAGQKYAFRLLMKEGGGGDYMDLGAGPAGTTFLETTNANAINQVLSASGLFDYGYTSPANTLEFTRHPQSKTATVGDIVTFTASARGQEDSSDQHTTDQYTTYEWKKGTTVVGTGRTLSYGPVVAGDNAASFTVTATTPVGGLGALSGTSSAATLTVDADTTAPSVSNAYAENDLATVRVVFSENISDSALTAGNYSIPGLTVTGAARMAGTFDTIRLTVTGMVSAQAYSLTINNVVDYGGNALPSGPYNFNAPSFQAGFVKQEIWDGSGSIADLNTRIANNEEPSRSTLLGRLQSAEALGDNYSARLSTFIVPADTADYVFYLSGDDQVELWLSTDSTYANRKRIAVEPQWAGYRAWTGREDGRRPGCGTVEAPTTDCENISNQYAASDWPTKDANSKATISLTGGNRYYTEILWHEGGGGDHAAATWTKAGEAAPGNGTDTVLTGARVGIIVDLANSSPVLKTAPVGGNVDAGGSITLSSEWDGATPMSFQWRKNKINIPGATNATYTISNASVKDIGDYSVQASNALGSANSGGDNAGRVLLNGAVLDIEAEHFNFDGGQTLAAASTVPLDITIYAEKTGTPNIDLFLGNESTADGGVNGNLYRQGYNRILVGDPAGTVVNAPTLGNVDVADNNGDLNRGSFTLTHNYKIGWNSAGEWYNYTRTLPAGEYAFVLAASRDVSDANRIQSKISVVTNPTQDAANQVETVIGQVSANGSGGWSSNDLIPYVDGNGNLSTYVHAGGDVTFRHTNASTGDDFDLDYILVYAVTTPPPAAEISIEGGAIVFTGTLQSADDPAGPYSDVAGASSPFSIPPAGGAAAKYYRAKSQ